MAAGRSPVARAARWKEGDRFRLRYDYDWRADKLAMQKGDAGKLTLVSYGPTPETTVAFAVFDKAPDHYPVAITLKALEREPEQLAARLNDGTVVLGKRYKGEVVPLHYSNRTQAERAAAASHGAVIQRGRPFYVRLPGAAPVTRPNPQWLNAPEVYENAGMEAGRSARHGDAATARKWKDWMGRALKLERAENRAAAQSLYDAAYRKVATPRGPVSNPTKRKPARPVTTRAAARVPRRELRAAVELYEKFREAPPRRLRRAEFRVPAVCLVIGHLDFVGYTTSHAGKRVRYQHNFAPGSRPLLCASSNGRQLLIFGGKYDFTADGIVDRR